MKIPKHQKYAIQSIRSMELETNNVSKWEEKDEAKKFLRDVSPESHLILQFVNLLKNLN